MNLNRVTKQAYIDSLRQSLESAGGEIRQLNTALHLEKIRLTKEETVTAQLKQEIRHLRATVMATTRVIDILNTQLGDNYQSQIYKADAEYAATMISKNPEVPAGRVMGTAANVQDTAKDLSSFRKR